MIGYQLTLQLQSIHARHAHIKNEAARVGETIRIQKLLGRGKYHRPEPD